jgi:hypothetical protein
MAGPRSAEQVASPRTGGGLPPTVGTLLVIIGLEIAAFLALRYTFRTVHGG